MKPCSEQILTLLLRKCPQSTASALDFVHNSCRVNLQLKFGQVDNMEHQVMPSYIIKKINGVLHKKEIH